MKISNQALQAYGRATTSSTTAPTTAGSDKSQAQQATAGTDPAQVSISAEARALASASSSYNEAKVSSIKSKIANGTYQVDPQQIAQRMLDESA